MPRSRRVRTTEASSPRDPWDVSGPAGSPFGSMLEAGGLAVRGEEPPILSPSRATRSPSIGPLGALSNVPTRLGGGLLPGKGEDPLGNLLWLVHPYVVTGTGEQDELRDGQELVQAPCHSVVQVGIGGAENDADRAGESPQPRDLGRSRPGLIAGPGCRPKNASCALGLTVNCS